VLSSLEAAKFLLRRVESSLVGRDLSIGGLNFIAGQISELLGSSSGYRELALSCWADSEVVGAELLTMGGRSLVVGRLPLIVGAMRDCFTLWRRPISYGKVKLSLCVIQLMYHVKKIIKMRSSVVCIGYSSILAISSLFAKLLL
jgi:hypothetical protein